MADPQTKADQAKNNALQKANETTAQIQQKAQNIKSSFSEGLTGLLGAGAGLLATGFMSKLSGQLSQVPAMGVISQLATVATTVKAVSVVTQIISNMTKKNINLNDKVREQSQAGQAITNPTGQITGGLQSEPIDTDASGAGELGNAQEANSSRKQLQSSSSISSSSVTPSSFSVNKNLGNINYNSIGLSQKNIPILTSGGGFGGGISQNSRYPTIGDLKNMKF